MKIVVAQCTDGKKDRPAMAKNLYSPSRLFQAQRKYATAIGDRWYIMSAKHGIIPPWREIHPYDMHISDQFDEGYQERLMMWAERMADRDCEVIIIAGGEYADRLSYWLADCGVSYRIPFEGQRIGTRIKNMREAARKAENKSLDAYA